MEAFAVLVVLLSLGVLVVLPVLPMLRRSGGLAGRVARWIALVGVLFFATWCFTPLFILTSDVTEGMTAFALYAAVIEAMCVALAAVVASYGDARA